MERDDLIAVRWSPPFRCINVTVTPEHRDLIDQLLAVLVDGRIAARYLLGALVELEQRCGHDVFR